VKYAQNQLTMNFYAYTIRPITKYYETKGGWNEKETEPKQNCTNTAGAAGCALTCNLYAAQALGIRGKCGCYIDNCNIGRSSVQRAEWRYTAMLELVVQQHQGQHGYNCQTGVFGNSDFTDSAGEGKHRGSYRWKQMVDVLSACNLYN